MSVNDKADNTKAAEIVKITQPYNFLIPGSDAVIVFRGDELVFHSTQSENLGLIPSGGDSRVLTRQDIFPGMSFLKSNQSIWFDDYSFETPYNGYTLYLSMVLVRVEDLIFCYVKDVTEEKLDMLYDIESQEKRLS